MWCLTTLCNSRSRQTDVLASWVTEGTQVVHKHPYKQNTHIQNSHSLAESVGYFLQCVCLRMCVCVSVFLCACMYICVCVSLYMSLCVYMWWWCCCCCCRSNPGPCACQAHALPRESPTPKAYGLLLDLNPGPQAPFLSCLFMVEICLGKSLFTGCVILANLFCFSELQFYL